MCSWRLDEGDRPGPVRLPDVLELRGRHPAPRPSEVLVRVRAASVNAADWHVMRGDPCWPAGRAPAHVRAERAQGSDPRHATSPAGSKRSARRSPGSGPATRCTATSATPTARSPSTCASPTSRWCAKPANLTFEQAAAVPLAGHTALMGCATWPGPAGQHVLDQRRVGRRRHLRRADRQGVGAEVTAVCSTRNVELVRSLGADHVIDYTRDDFTREAGATTSCSIWWATVRWATAGGR